MYPVTKKMLYALFIFSFSLYWTACASSPDVNPLVMEVETPPEKEIEAVEVKVEEEEVFKEPETGNVYISPGGEIFVKSKNPIYLRIGMTAEKEEGELTLRNEASRNGTQPPKPLYFEGHGRHTIIHPPAKISDIRKRKGSDLFKVFVDGKGPVISYSTSNVPKITGKGGTILGKPAQVSLKYYDKNSGLFGSYISLDGGSYKPYEGPVSLMEERDYILNYYALDNVNNRSQEYKRTFSMDFTPPESSYVIVNLYRTPEGEIVLSPKSSISLSSSDKKAGVKHIYYGFGASKRVYDRGAPLKLTKFSDGPKRLAFYARDRVGNVEAGKELLFYLDRKAPGINFSVDGDMSRRNKTTYVSGRSSAMLSATDNKAGVREINYYGNDKKGRVYSEPVSFPRRNGKYIFAYSATDKVGNKTKVNYRKVVVDISPPKSSASFKGPHYYSRKTHYVRKQTMISLLASDNLSGIRSRYYTVDDGSEVDYKKPFSFTEEGEHSLSFYAADNVNNMADAKKIKIFVDETGPEIYSHFSIESTMQGEKIYPKKSKLYLAATDEHVGVKTIYYRINKGKERVYKRPIFFSKSGNYSVNMRAVDKLGNVSKSETRFQIR